MRPFYYARTPGRFIFASSVEAVLAAPGVSQELDEATVAAFLTRVNFWSPERTFFRALRKLPPGHALTVEGSAARLDRYWRPEQAPKARPATDAVHAEAFLDLFSRAVKDRLRGADPVGVHLSGGLDSSSVAVLAARELRRQGRPPPLAFSWLPEPGGRPPREDHAREYTLIDAVCEREGLQVFHRSPGPEDVIATLRHDVARPGVHVHMNEEVVQRCAEHRSGHLGERMEGWAASGARRGIEYRYPLLDRRLLEFALGLPPEQYRRGRWNRWLMRHALGAALRGAPSGTSAGGPVLPPEVCWNRSKADPARIDPLYDSFAEALPALRRELLRRAPARACYVDMPRLLDSLDTDRFRAMPRMGPIRTALQLLDF